MATPTLASQLHQAWLESGITHAQLCELAKLDCSPDSLSRKLRGKQPLTTTEAEGIAKALHRTIVWPALHVRRAKRTAAA